MITTVQLDPNGLCNSSCWFCPVAYKPNPEFAKGNMSLEMLESILKQLKEGKGDFVHPDLRVIYTAHYNEVLLYKDFEELLKLLIKYGFKTDVLSNGIAFTKARIDLIDKYWEAVEVVNLNIPSSNAERWSQLVNKPPQMFEKIKDSIQYALNKRAFLDKKVPLRICVNGIQEQDLSKNGGHIDLLENAPELNLDPKLGDQAKTVSQFNQMFPGVDAYAQAMVDRAGLLVDSNIVTNMVATESRLSKPIDQLKVIGCGYGHNDSRTENWLHINSNGQIFICCNDFDMKSVFGDLREKTIKEVWESPERRAMIQKSYDTMCRRCLSAIWAEK